MYLNEDGKYTSHAEYFYNPFIGLYCIIGSTIAMESVDDLIELFESPDLLTEVALPEYITDENYESDAW